MLFYRATCADKFIINIHMIKEVVFASLLEGMRDGKRDYNESKGHCFLFIVNMDGFVPPAYASGAMSSSDERTVDQLVEAIATDFAEPEADAELLSIQPVSDDYWEQELWSVRWITPEHNIIEVELDAFSHEIVFFLDTDRLHEENADSFPMSDEAAQRIATSFLDKLERFGFNPIPEDAKITELRVDGNGWQLSWTHVVGTVPVLEDFIRIRVSRESDSVYSYAKCWHPVGSVPEPLLSRSDAMDIARRQDSLSINSTILCDFSIVGRVLDGRVSYEPQLAWVTTARSQYGSRIVYCIDARTGETISRDTTLDTYEDVFAWDPSTDATYECALDIYHRLDSATALHPRYYEDPTHSQEVSQLEYEQVFYHIGHGGYVVQGWSPCTYLCTETDNIMPSTCSYSSGGEACS